MEIDEAIKHCEEVAEEKQKSCVECARDHLQLAEWLKELKRLRKQVSSLERPEQKIGHWIETDGGVECDKCGKWYPHAIIAQKTIKYCCKCGAKLGGDT